MKPKVANGDLGGEHGLIFDMLAHLNGRIDKMMWGIFATLLTMVGILATLLTS